MALDDPGSDRQAQPVAALLVIAAGVDAIERFEQPLEVLLRHAASIVGHGQYDLTGSGLEVDLDA